MTQSSDTPQSTDPFIDALKNKVAMLAPGESAKVGAPMGENELRNILHAVGLHRVRPWKLEEQEKGYTYLEAYKPDPKPVAGVVAIISLPRYGLMKFWGAAVNALTPNRIPCIQGYGVYWSEVMTELMVEQLDKYRYILTLDYDGVFDAADVSTLLHLMEETPDAGAICAVQMHREKPTAILQMKNGETHPPLDAFDQDLTEVRSALFGLTVIRTDALSRLSKPWFQATPDRNGEWKPEAGYCSADVGFWHKFTAEGFKLYQANHVAIGHIEEMVVWPSRRLTPVIQHIESYRKAGIPNEALR